MQSLIRSTLVATLIGPALLSAAQPSAPEAASQASPSGGKAAQAYAELQKKAYSQALVLYEQALAAEPGRPELWNEYAICLRDLRRFPAAARAGWRAIQLDGGKTVQLWNAQANTFMETRAWKAAQTCLEKAEGFQKEPTSRAKAWLNLAFRMLAAGTTEGVVDISLRATQLDPGNSLAWIDLGLAQACSGDSKGATASLAKGLAMAEKQKDSQRADSTRQLLAKVKAGEAVWPPVVAGRSWQTVPDPLLRQPEGDARQVALPASVDHHYTLASGNSLSLTLPETWAEAFGADLPGTPFSIHFSQPGHEGFKVLFSPIPGAGNPAGVKATAEDVVKRLKDRSAEKELVLHELSSAFMKGYWVLSTNDKEPAKGEYRHLLSAQLDVGGTQCVGTVLSNSKETEVLDPCLAVFSSARMGGIPANR